MNSYSGITTHEDWLCSSCSQPWRECPCRPFTRRRFGFVGMLRVRNEARWIGEVIASILPLCSHVFILDDHSTDATVRICSAFERVTVFESPFTGLNEARDKNWLYDQIIAFCEPQWILCIDGDEVLDEGGARAICESCAGADAPHAFALKIEYLWNDPRTVRTDRIYGDFWRPSLFRPFHENPMVPDSRTLLREFRFMSTPFGRRRNGDEPNLHCSSVPQRFLHGFKFCPARLKHYGYMLREWRVKKLDYYTSIDWKNAAEDCYRHMCQGDYPTLEELPRVRELIARGELMQADARFLMDVKPADRLVHAGPIELRPWVPGKWEMSDWARGGG